jgi:hypothetical protein
MDHDAMLKDVNSLKAFRTRVENAIAYVEYLKKLGIDPDALAALSKQQPGVQVNQPGAVGMSDADRASLKATLDGFGDRVTKLETAFADSGHDDGLATRVAAVEEGLKTFSGGDFVDRVTAMLTWFDANKDGLEVLLSLDGDPDQAPADLPGTGTVAPAAGATGTSDTPAAAAGTAAPGTDPASPAAPPAASGTV